MSYKNLGKNAYSGNILEKFYGNIYKRRTISAEEYQ